MSMEELKNSFGEYARDIKLNLGSVLSPEGAPDLTHVIGRGPVPFLERDQDLTIRRGDQGAFAEREVEPAVRDAQVVEQRRDLGRWDHGANGVFDGREALLGFLDTQAWSAAHVELDQTGVHAREEVPTQERHEDDHRQRDEREEHADERGAVLERPGQPAAIRGTQPHEPAVEGRKEAPRPAGLAGAFGTMRVRFLLE